MAGVRREHHHRGMERASTTTRATGDSSFLGFRREFPFDPLARGLLPAQTYVASPVRYGQNVTRRDFDYIQNAVVGILGDDPLRVWRPRHRRFGIGPITRAEQTLIGAVGVYEMQGSPILLYIRYLRPIGRPHRVISSHAPRGDGPGGVIEHLDPRARHECDLRSIRRSCRTPRLLGRCDDVAKNFRVRAIDTRPE